MTTLYEELEQRDQLRTREARSVGHFEVRYVDAHAWLARLAKDVQVIEDRLVWLAIVSGPATLDEVYGKPVTGGHRNSPYYAARYVEASYLARGQIRKLSVYCGVYRVAGEAGTPARAEEDAQLQQGSFEKLTKVGHAVLVGLSRYPQLDVDNGGALHLHNVEEPWRAHPDQTIEAVPEPVCAVCGVRLHFANERWRDDDGRYETLKDAPGRFGTIKALDHEHTVEVQA